MRCAEERGRGGREASLGTRKRTAPRTGSPPPPPGRRAPSRCRTWCWRGEGAAVRSIRANSRARTPTTGCSAARRVVTVFDSESVYLAGRQRPVVGLDGRGHLAAEAALLELSYGSVRLAAARSTPRGDAQLEEVREAGHGGRQRAAQRVVVQKSTGGRGTQLRKRNRGINPQCAATHMDTSSVRLP